MTQDELSSLHDRITPWFRQLPEYTGSFVQTDPSGAPVLVVMMNPLTNQVEAQVRAKMPDAPLRFENVPPFAIQVR